MLAACAFSPQQLSIAPQWKSYLDDVGAGRSFSLRVKDVRDDPVVGYRGGVYRESSTIRVVDLESGLKASLSAAMQQLGYLHVDATGEEALQIAIFIDKLNYGSPDVLYSNRVDMDTLIRVEIHRANLRVANKSSFTKSYATTAQRRFTLAPNLEENQRLINEMLGQTLRRIFNDASFLAFIS